jgi:hypothetical protein
MGGSSVPGAIGADIIVSGRLGVLEMVMATLLSSCFVAERLYLAIALLGPYVQGTPFFLRV